MRGKIIVERRRYNSIVHGQPLVQLPEKRLAAIGEMFPGIFAVEDHRAQRVVALRGPGHLFDLADHVVGRPLRIVTRRREPNEIAQRPLAEREARAGIAKLRAVTLEQRGAVEDPTRMHYRQATPEILLIGGEPLITEFLQ